MKFFLLTLFTIASCAFSQAQDEQEAPPEAPAAATAAVKPPADKQNFHLYLLIGQSNMAGRDVREIPPPLNSPQILTFTSKNQWGLAKEPLHPLKEKGKAGTGPGISFAQEMLKAQPKVTIGLIPCAVGGTKLQRWVKGGDLYEKAVARAKQAAQTGQLSGVLWHQGESDTREKKDAETYEDRVVQMLKDLRTDLGMPDLPIVVGQIGGFLEKEKFPYAAEVRKAIKHIPAKVPHVGYADSDKLGDMGDLLHFSAESQKQMGARYAAEMLKLTK